MASGPIGDLRTAGARVLFAIARATLRAIAPIVPSERRDDWRDEWTAELWYDLASREQRTLGAMSALAFVWRLAGSLPHAVQVRRNDWRLDMIIQDLQYALRGTLRRPLFTSLVIATLALGIGVNTAMFTIVNSVLIQPLPYRDPGRLVLMYGSFSKFDRASISPPDFVDYRAQNTVFASFAGQRLDGTAVLTGDGDPEQVTATDVTANYFTTLGVAPIRGRMFVPAEEQAGGPDVALVSYGLWQRRFGGDPNLVGKTISVDGHVRSVIGIMPAVLDQTLGIQVWRPMQFHTPETSVRRFHFMRAIGRLKPGVSIERAQAGMDAIAKQLETAYPENATWHLNLIPLRDAVVGDVGRVLVMLLASVALVLLIACGNVASLLLARASARRGEIAIRTALGASRSRLLRQLLTESLMLSVAGGMVGLVLAAELVRSLRIAGDGMLPRLAEVTIDPTVLAFTMALSIITGVIFGLAPALHAMRGASSETFGSLGKSSGVRGATRARDGLVVAQVALSLVLLSGAGLLVRSLWKLQHVDPGFASDHLLTAELSLPASRYPTPDVRLAFWRDLEARTRALPGARLSSITTMLPLRGGGDTYYYIEGQPPATEADRRNAQISSVGDDYFATMRIPIIAGRAFDAPERSGGPNSIVISRRMAARLFPNESAIGKRLVVDFGTPFTGAIVGVAGDVRAFGLASRPPDIMYFSLHQLAGFSRGSYGNVVIRTDADPLALAGGLRSTIAAMDRDIPLANLRTMDDIVAQSTSRERFSTRLLAGFAASALLLAVVGLYGVLAYVVMQRTRELGIRIALGAPRREIFALVARRGLVIVGVGVCLGLAGSAITTRFLERMLFDVRRTDPIVFVTVTVALIAAGAAACIVPARQATRVDPVTALRSEG